ncbi:hypothetical protein DYI37_03105 [Fulvimarina endophytica]|uniref:Phage tail protein n=1 Tax=Fulvimarina endophytica TaxID=2293836 RepID=A0A371XB27_9HYPH|nr:phage tail tube protein [Fulvimarina endophytica]RFC66446.1 hypothetical protein DYI37_03105 [Fulvimarina endophytica]
MGIFTSSGTKVFIGPAVTAVPADATAYAALAFDEISYVKNAGEIGDQFQDVTTDHLGDGRTRHFKGQKDGGVMQLIVDRDDADAGQTALIAAVQDDSTADYAFMVEFPNKRNPTGENAIRYFTGKAMGQREGGLTPNSMTTMTVNVGINSDITYVASTAGA